MNLKLPLLLGCCLFAAITACAETSASLDENAAGKKKADVYITTADRQQSFNHTTQKLSKTPAFESVITLNSARCAECRQDPSGQHPLCERG